MIASSLIIGGTCASQLCPLASFCSFAPPRVLGVTYSERRRFMDPALCSWRSLRLAATVGVVTRRLRSRYLIWSMTRRRSWFQARSTRRRRSHYRTRSIRRQRSRYQSRSIRRLRRIDPELRLFMWFSPGMIFPYDFIEEESARR